ncbi:hypothetical protein FW320_19710 [Azospirillum sp. Vi22]|nr:hypothetical protein [Azospirillum baldaniorum]
MRSILVQRAGNPGRLAARHSAIRRLRHVSHPGRPTRAAAPCGAIRDNPASGEHRLVHDFNASLVANPIPV